MPKLPNFQYEKAVLKRLPDAIIVGVDEAGCAPLAGPVVAGAVILDQKKLPKSLRQGLDDSKKLALEKREELYGILVSCDAAVVGVGRAEVHEIESFNILNAAHLAMRRAVASLGRAATFALIDGNRTPKEFPCDLETIVKGDGKSLSIAAASVVAKVTRDRYMVELARKYPGYGWENNVGYPTPAHTQGHHRPRPHAASPQDVRASAHPARRRRAEAGRDVRRRARLVNRQKFPAPSLQIESRDSGRLNILGSRSGPLYDLVTL